MTMSLSNGPQPAGGPKRMMKVLCPVDKNDAKGGSGGGTYWIRCGTAFWNRDQSINLYLDVLPRNGRLQLRELDEEDLRERDPMNPRRRGGARMDAAPANDEQLPF
jgi:hypothetical protein